MQAISRVRTDLCHVFGADHEETLDAAMRALTVGEEKEDEEGEEGDSDEGEEEGQAGDSGER